MALINSSVVLTTQEAICLLNLLNPPMTPQTFQKLSIPFTIGLVMEHGQNALKSDALRRVLNAKHK